MAVIWGRHFRSHVARRDARRRDGDRDRNQPRRPHGRQAAVRRRLLQARAARADDALRPQRRRQVDPAAPAGGRAVPRRRQPRPAERGARRPARPAPAARDRDLARRVRLLRPRRDAGDGGRAGAPRGGDVRRRDRGGDPERLRRRPAAARARRRLPLARRRPLRPARPRLRRRGGRALALDLLRRRADPRLAGAGAGERARPAAARRADQPPRHPLAGVAGALPARPRRRGRPRRPRPLVPGGGRHLGAGAGGAAGALLRRPLARLAQGAGRPRDRPRQGDRAPAGRDRPHGALRRALPLQGDQGAPGAVAAEADRPDQARGGGGGAARPPQPALLLRPAGAARAGSC